MYFYFIPRTIITIIIILLLLLLLLLLEHTSMMAFVINKARLKQRSIIITLLDLKNAFGEVHHNLIKSVLEYHHIPESLQLLIANLYTDFHSHIISDSFSTPAIPCNRGVLQGDCLSPLILICALIPSLKSLNRKSIISSVSLLMMKTTAYFIPVIGFNLQMMLL